MVDKLSQYSMKSLMVFWVLFLMGTLSGCLDGGGSSTPTASSPTVTTPTVSTPVVSIPAVSPVVSTPDDSQVVVSPTPTSVNLTYYSLTKTTEPQSGSGIHTTVTMTGSCASYQSKEYCWDDGIHSMHIGAPFNVTDTYTYWGLATSTNSEGFTICFGSCPSDHMSSPLIVDATLSSGISAAMSDTDNSVSEIFSSGIEESVSCTELNNVLTCPSFTIQL